MNIDSQYQDLLGFVFTLIKDASLCLLLTDQSTCNLPVGQKSPDLFHYIMLNLEVFKPNSYIEL